MNYGGSFNKDGENTNLMVIIQSSFATILSPTKYPKTSQYLANMESTLGEVIEILW